MPTANNIQIVTERHPAARERRRRPRPPVFSYAIYRHARRLQRTSAQVQLQVAVQ
jgi:hypothetical protein